MPGFEIIDSKERKAINRLFDEGGVFLAHGFENKRKNFYVREFEDNLSDYFNSKHVLVVSSGTAAIKIALKALGVKRGDEVITQAFNFIATIEAIKDVGAIPIICDIDETLNMNISHLLDLISYKTKAIIPVHMLGMSARINEICSIAKSKNIKVLEDNCEAIGGKYNNKYLGTIGDIGVMSFDHAKMITCGEGGAIFTNNKKLSKYCREYHDHGHENNPRYTRGNDTKSIYGFNYRMTELQAVVGIVQLKKLKFMINENKKRFNILQSNLSNKINQRAILTNSTPNYDCFIFYCNNKVKLRKLIEKLDNQSIGTKNLPSAIKWHCAFYWNHALNKKQIKNSLNAKKTLENAVAIPILIKVSIKKYIKIAHIINSVIS